MGVDEPRIDQQPDRVLDVAGLIDVIVEADVAIRTRAWSPSRDAAVPHESPQPRAETCRTA